LVLALLQLVSHSLPSGAKEQLTKSHL